MKFKKLCIKEVMEITPKILSDNRGFFCETFRLNFFLKKIKKKINFVKDNISKSKKNTLRGLHYQISNTQDKLITVIDGKIFDVAVDLRKKSKTFGKYVSCELSSRKRNLLWVPKGFAHGFYVLSKTAIVSYKVTGYYDKNGERTLLWKDKKINIKWPMNKKIIISNKDKKGKKLDDLDCYF